MCVSRHAIVVIGAGSGAGQAQSIEPSGRTVQQSGTGSQRYSSSVSPSSLGRSWPFQCQSSCSCSCSVQVAVIAPPSLVVGPVPSAVPGPPQRKSRSTADDRQEEEPLHQRTDLRVDAAAEPAS